MVIVGKAWSGTRAGGCWALAVTLPGGMTADRATAGEQGFEECRLGLAAM